MSNKQTLFGDQCSVESTRYAILRRLASVFRHDFVGSMQPLSIMCQVLRLKLQRTPVDVLAVTESVEKTQALIAKATQSNLDALAWLAGGDDRPVAVGVGVAECINLLQSSLSFCGFDIFHEKCTLEFDVNATVLREVLTATILAATDHAMGLSGIEIQVLPKVDTVEIALQMRRGSNDSTSDINAYRLIHWEEVERLARFHGVGLQQPSDGLVKVQMDRAPADQSVAVS